MNLPKIKLYVIIIISIVAIAFLYRILVDETVSSATMTGLIIVLTLLFLTLLSDKITEFSAGIKGVSAKLEGVEKGVADIKDFFYGAIDEGASETLKLINENKLQSPNSEEEQGSLKFRLRTLRQTGFVLRDETKCKSISKAVKQGGNISNCFILTRLAKDYLQKLAKEDKSVT